MSAQEETGEAYLLSPSSVMVSLTPLGGLVGLPSGSAGTVDSRDVQPSDGPLVAPADPGELARLGLGAAATQIKPVEKKWTSSSSSSSAYSSPDGTTQVTKKSTTSTSVGVGLNPVGLLNVLDTLFK